MKAVKNFALLGIFPFLLTACGGTGGGGAGAGGCDTALTVNYVNNEFITEPPFFSNGITVSNTTLIHTDGDQGGTFDIDKIIMSRTAVSSTTHFSGNSLALSYSIFTTTAPSNDTYVAFYIDTDDNPMTGESIGTIGADALILNDSDQFSVQPLSPFSLSYYESAGAGWVPQSTLGTLSSAASYIEGCTMNTAVYAPLYTGMAALSGMNAKGVMKVITLTNGDPDTYTPTAVIDTTTEFNFTVP